MGFWAVAILSALLSAPAHAQILTAELTGTTAETTDATVLGAAAVGRLDLFAFTDLRHTGHQFTEVDVSWRTWRGVYPTYEINQVAGRTISRGGVQVRPRVGPVHLALKGFPVNSWGGMAGEVAYVVAQGPLRLIGFVDIERDPSALVTEHKAAWLIWRGFGPMVEYRYHDVVRIERTLAVGAFYEAAF